MKNVTPTSKSLLLVSTLLAFVFLSSCVEEPHSEVINGNFTVQFLFEQDGCKMYRFKDGGRYVYWSNCEGRSQADYSTQSGKTRVTHHLESVTSK